MLWDEIDVPVDVRRESWDEPPSHPREEAADGLFSEIAAAREELVRLL